MCQIRDVILYGHTLDHLLSNVNNGYQNKGQRDLSLVKARKGSQNDEGKYDAAGSAERYLGEEDKIDKSHDKGRKENDLQDRLGACFSSSMGPKINKYIAFPKK